MILFDRVMLGIGLYGFWFWGVILIMSYITDTSFWGGVVVFHLIGLLVISILVSGFLIGKVIDDL